MNIPIDVLIWEQIKKEEEETYQELLIEQLEWPTLPEENEQEKLEKPTCIIIQM